MKKKSGEMYSAAASVIWKREAIKTVQFYYLLSNARTLPIW